MPSGLHNWSQTAPNNATADSAINWAEGQAPASVNDSARAVMAVIAKWRDDNNGSLSTGGTSTAYTLTTNTVFTTLALMANQTVAFTMHTTSGATPTLNVDGLGAKVIRNATGVALPTGALLSGSVYRATYNNSSGEWLLHNQPGVLPTSSVATASIADDAVTYAKMQNVSATARLLGRVSSGSGDVEEISLGSGLSFSGTSLITSIDAAVFPGFLSGLELSYSSTTAFGIATGGATDAAQGGMMALTSAITKTTSAWAVGSGNGGLDTSSIAINTWYHVFLIKRPDTGVVDVLFSVSPTSPTMPTNYTLKRRIGSLRTNASSQWTKFYQVGDEFLWDVPVTDVNVSSGTPSGLQALTVPPDFSVLARMNLNMRSTSIGGNILLHSPLTANQTQGTPAGNVTAVAVNAGVDGYYQVNVITDTSRQIRASSNGTGTITWSIVTYGWNDRRGR